MAETVLKKGDAVLDSEGNRGVVLTEMQDGSVFVAFSGHGCRRCAVQDLKPI